MARPKQNSSGRWTTAAHDPTSAAIRAIVCAALGDHAFDAGNLAGAREEYAKALRNDPTVLRTLVK